MLGDMLQRIGIADVSAAEKGGKHKMRKLEELMFQFGVVVDVKEDTREMKG